MSQLLDELNLILQEKQDKIKPENIKKGIQIFDIEGTYEGNSGGVKLFETEEQMQADTNAQEGDLAVIYRSEIQNMTANTQTQYITFPETVTLPTAFSSNVYCMLRAIDSSSGYFDGDIQLSQSSFRFDGFSDSGMIQVRYTSSDGINYTRTTFRGDAGDLTNPVDLGTTIQVLMPEEWNNNMGYFMQTGGSTFEGLYEYDSNHISETNFGLLPISGINISEETYTGKPLGNYNKDDIGKIVQKIKEELELNLNSMTLSIGTIDNKLMITFYVTSDKTSGSSTSLCYDKTNSRYQIESSYSLSGNLYVYELDTSNSTYKLLYNEISPGSFYYLNVSGNLDSLFVVATSYSDGTFKVNSNSPAAIYSSENGQSSGVIIFSGDDINSILFLDDPKYILAPTQLTTTKDLVYNSTYYGRDGINEGILTQNVSNSFADINAEIMYKIQQAYNNMEPRVLTDSDMKVDRNIYFIPTNLNGEPLLDTSSVTNASSMFNYCSNLQSIPLLDTSNVTIMYSMFSGCNNLQSVPLLDTSKVTSMQSMFSSCRNLQSVPLLDTSQVTNMQSMFSYCIDLQSVPLLDTSKVTNMQNMFSNCENLLSIPQLNTSQVTDMTQMFSGCANLQSISLLDTSKVTDMRFMFHECTNLTTIPQLNTSNVTNMQSMFYGCSNLQSVPLLDTSQVTTMQNMFSSCTNLTTIPLLDTSQVTNMSVMLDNCTNLQSVPSLNTSNATNMIAMFYGCDNLNNESLNNILQMCINAVSYTKTKTLKSIGLSETQAQTCTTLSNYQEFLNASWTTGY